MDPSVAPPSIKDIVLYLEKEGFLFSKVLGRGTYSVVYEARCEKDQQMLAHSVAVKLCNKCLFGDYELWPKLKHPKLVDLLRKINLNDVKNVSVWKVAYLMPVMQCNLKNYLAPFRQVDTVQLSLELIREWILGLVNAVKYLHGKNMFHLDIKITNLMISSENSLLLGDFSTLLETEEKVTYGQIGLPSMLKPPEVLELEGKVFRVLDPAAVDVWGIGLVVVQLVLGDSVWRPAVLCIRQGGNNAKLQLIISELISKLNDKATFKTLLNNARPSPLFNDQEATACWSFIKMCVHSDPDERKRLFQIAENHSFLACSAGCSQ